MRITGGALARRPIDAPRGDRTRPTTDRVREALFSMLGSRLTLGGARVLDLFAGSGALGLEALSRGAAHATFVERHGPTLAVAKRNARALGVADQAAFLKADALAVVASGEEPFDLVLANILAEPLIALAPRIEEVLAPGGRVLLAGLLERQAEAVIEAYAARRLSVTQRGGDSWPILLLRRHESN